MLAATFGMKKFHWVKRGMFVQHPVDYMRTLPGSFNPISFNFNPLDEVPVYSERLLLTGSSDGMDSCKQNRQRRDMLRVSWCLGSWA